MQTLWQFFEPLYVAYVSKPPFPTLFFSNACVIDLVCRTLLTIFSCISSAFFMLSAAFKVSTPQHFLHAFTCFKWIVHQLCRDTNILWPYNPSHSTWIYVSIIHQPLQWQGLIGKMHIQVRSNPSSYVLKTNGSKPSTIRQGLTFTKLVFRVQVFLTVNGGINLCCIHVCALLIIELFLRVVVPVSWSGPGVALLVLLTYSVLCFFNELEFYLRAAIALSVSFMTCFTVRDKFWNTWLMKIDTNNPCDIRTSITGGAHTMCIADLMQ